MARLQISQGPVERYICFQGKREDICLTHPIDTTNARAFRAPQHGRMAAVFADLALKAAKENISNEAYLFEPGTLEEELRTQRRTARLLPASALPADKTFRTLHLGKLSPASDSTPQKRHLSRERYQYGRH